MDYVPYTWKNGEVITEDKLNYMERGIANDSVFVVTVVFSPGVPTTCDKTFEEIKEAYTAGKFVYLNYKNTTMASEPCYYILSGVYQYGARFVGIYVYDEDGEDVPSLATVSISNTGEVNTHYYNI